MALFGSAGDFFGGMVSDVWGLTKSTGSMLGVNQSLTNIRKKIAPNDNSAQIADNNLAAQKLLSDQKAAADLQEQTKLAGSAYGSLGGQNIQSTTNKSGKKSILGSF